MSAKPAQLRSGLWSRPGDGLVYNKTECASVIHSIQRPARWVFCSYSWSWSLPINDLHGDCFSYSWWWAKHSPCRSFIWMECERCVKHLHTPNNTKGAVKLLPHSTLVMYLKLEIKFKFLKIKLNLKFNFLIADNYYSIYTHEVCIRPNDFPVCH